MSIEVKESHSGKIVEVHINGKLTKLDYQHFVPELETLIDQHDHKIRILVEMEDFHGWEAGALWEDLKFDFKHFNDIDRLAMVGDSKWEKGMSYFCRPFTTAAIKYFDRQDINKARVRLKMSMSQPDHFSILTP